MNSNAEFLRSLAQNDYMIDGHYLPDGQRLNALADAIELATEAMPDPNEVLERGRALLAGWPTPITDAVLNNHLLCWCPHCGEGHVPRIATGECSKHGENIDPMCPECFGQKNAPQQT